MTLTERARTRRDHQARKNARRRLDDPMVRAVILQRVFGKGWQRMVEDFYAQKRKHA